MTSAPFRDAVAIDTNVFQHLLNPQNNPDGHIDELLIYLIRQRAQLLVDDQGDIESEYHQQLLRRIRQANDVRAEIQILRYWVLYADRFQTSIDQSDSLMTAIQQIVHEASEDVDRVFVYVAFRQGTTLISNDRRHIVIGTPEESSPRRERLLIGTAELRPSGARILTSQEAHAEI